jgi:hypothetical protein
MRTHRRAKVVGEITCYICGRKAEGWDRGNLYSANCSKCGNYTLKDLAFRLRLIRGTKKALASAEREQLSRAVKAEYEKGKRRVFLNPEKIDKLAGRPLKPTRINIA